MQALVTLIVGLIAAIGVGFTVWQRTRADNRAQSWNRITWCLERTISIDDAEAELGWTVFGVVAATPFIARTDREVLRAVANRVAADDLAEIGQTADNESDDAREEQP